MSSAARMLSRRPHARRGAQLAQRARRANARSARCAATNGTLMQYYQWYLEENILWEKVSNEARNLSNAGITALWLPPFSKGDGPRGVGYGVYDLYDLGEFNQRGTVRTKYGTKEQLLRAIADAQSAGMEVYADIVLNHRVGADSTQLVTATPYNPWNRDEAIGGPRQIEAYTYFNFPGRGGKYSQYVWDAGSFDSVDYDQRNPGYKFNGQNPIYLLEGHSHDQFVSLERGNFDYLLGADVDFDRPWVVEELTRWGKWLLDTTGVDGFRIDAIKHIPSLFYKDWLPAMRDHAGRDLFALGEYYENNLGVLEWYLGSTERTMSLLDVPLHYFFYYCSRDPGNMDLRKVFDNTLTGSDPTKSVTFVDNHDTQPLQALESWVQDWFKPLAYAMILLREAGYPIVFYGDYYGAEYSDRGQFVRLNSFRGVLDTMLSVRKDRAYGQQNDYLDDYNVIGWTRLGTSEHPGGIAVLLSNAGDGRKWMQASPNTTFYDILGNEGGNVTTNGEGWGEFRCRGGSVSVWVV